MWPRPRQEGMKAEPGSGVSLEKGSTPSPQRIRTSRCHHHPDMIRHGFICRHTCPTPRTPRGSPPEIARLEATTSTVEHIKDSATLDEMGSWTRWGYLAWHEIQRRTVTETSLPIDSHHHREPVVNSSEYPTPTPVRGQPPRWGGVEGEIHTG